MHINQVEKGVRKVERLAKAPDHNNVDFKLYFNTEQDLNHFIATTPLVLGWDDVINRTKLPRVYQAKVKAIDALGYARVPDTANYDSLSIIIREYPEKLGNMIS